MKNVIPQQVTVTCDVCGNTTNHTKDGFVLIRYRTNDALVFSNEEFDVCDNCFNTIQTNIKNMMVFKSNQG